MPIINLKKKEEALKQIAEAIQKCRTCRRQKTGVAVPGEGNANADIVFVGEAPGKQEAASGRPFIGRAGKLLRSLITQTGLKEEDVYITSPVKYLPIHITPTPQEVAHGRTHLMKQLDVIQPKIIVLLGRVAVLAMLEENIVVGKEHGKTLVRDGRTYFIAYHPAAALHSPTMITPLRADFKKLKRLVSKK